MLPRRARRITYAVDALRRSLAERLDASLPDALTRLILEKQVAAELAALTDQVHAQQPGIEIACVLFGTPPDLGRPARVYDFEPLDSESTLGTVDVAPASFASAAGALRERHPDRRDQIVGVLHTHSGSERPKRSSIDRDWHALLLDDHRRRELCLELPGGRAGGSLHAQVFYSVILSEHAVLDTATAYLLLRVAEAHPESDFEYEIELVGADAAQPRCPRVGFVAEVQCAPDSRWRYRVRFA